MSSSPAGFLRDRLDDAERIARAAMEYTDRDWTAHVEPDQRYGWRAFLHGDADPIGELDPFGKDPRPIVAHIVRWDPAAVLADCTAKRRIIELHWTTIDQTGGVDGPPLCNECCGDYAPCDTLRALVQPFRAHPDFDPAWAVD